MKEVKWHNRDTYRTMTKESRDYAGNMGVMNPRIDKTAKNRKIFL